MAEAVVEERPQTRFYCHMCDVEFQIVGSNFTCPHCSDGFIEELPSNENQGTRGPDLSLNRVFDDDDEMEDPPDHIFLNDFLVRRRSEGGASPFPRPMLRSVPGRQALPIEHLVHDFIINLGVGINWGEQGNVQLFLGNPGDYAWGREGLDAIVTQLLNQMETTGPPPLSKDVIDALQIVEVTEEQVGQNLQCSVCWEVFQLKEQVRQLPCQHIYHENCIRPWLELHGTCPICRQNLGGNGETAAQNNSEQPRESHSTEDYVQSFFHSVLGSRTVPSSSNNQTMDESGGSSNVNEQSRTEPPSETQTAAEFAQSLFQSTLGSNNLPSSSSSQQMDQSGSSSNVNERMDE
ncbi:E3 ubiquitin-protein ligase Iruka-like isoform X1 [Rhynchophorus ferrugineus]|uniref:E3 ubiquitin-protein ligase Iruka-like isoform X1 n=2 Tax=Rhynchophorus ferrugineus TaxID=354439 RepID=UPI003FCD67F9